MKRSTLAAAAAALVLGASSAQAQAASPTHFGISAGATIPTGDLSDSHNAGFNVQALLEFRGIASPLAFRAEVGYHGLGGKSVTVFDPDFGTVSADVDDLAMIMGTANGVYSFPVATTATVRPYVIGGAGIYNYKAGGSFSSSFGSFSGSERQTKFGLNGGIGTTFQLSGFNTFAEARYHYVFAKDDDTGEGNLQMIPLSFGIMF